MIVGETKADVYESLKNLVYLADLTLPPDEAETMKLHLHLYEYYNGSYPIDTFLKELAPDCKDLVQSCIWQEEPMDCSKYFQLRLTYYGMCCIFNYIRPELAVYK